MSPRVYSQYALLILASLLAGTCTAQEISSAGNKGGEPTAAQKYFTDVTLINQDGQPMRLYSDLMKDKIVIIDSFFTTCKGSCPILSSRFAKVQDWLGDRLGKDVYLVSISVDPEADTPAKLKIYGQQFHAKPGWYFLSGSKPNVDFALHKLGLSVDEKSNHLNLFLVGNDKTGLWKKLFGLSKTEEIVAAIDSVIKDNQ